MQVDHGAERLGALPERVERGMVEVLPVGVAVDHGANDAQFAHCAFKLAGRGHGVLHREVGKARIAAGTFLYLAGEEIVRFPCTAHRNRGVALDLHTGPGDRENGTFDAVAIHLGDAQVGEFSEPRHRLAENVRRNFARRGLPIVLEARRQEMLLKRDFLDHLGFPSALLSNVGTIRRIEIRNSRFRWGGASCAGLQRPHSPSCW